MTVVTARELDDEVAAGCAAGQAHGAHDRLGTGRHEAHLFDAGIGIDDRLGELDLGAARRAERHAAFRRLADRLDDLGMGVA